jgi:4-alpha-glucanotransferase
MSYTDDFIWSLMLNIPVAQQIDYYYEIENHDGKFVADMFGVRRLSLDATCREVFIKDEFGCEDIDSVFYTTLFAGCFAPKRQVVEPLPAMKHRWLFRVDAPAIEGDCAVGLLGSHLRFGEWGRGAIIPFDPLDYPTWQGQLDVVENTTPVEYKFVIYKPENGEIVCWEEGENRVVCFDNRADDTQVISTRFRRKYTWKGAGVAVPVFSLRSDRSGGVGEFLDLKLLVDWAHKTSQKMIQILPVNDTTATHTDADSYPYRINSIYALHPIYIRMEAVGKLSDCDKAAVFEKKRQALNAQKKVDYAAVCRMKWDYLKLIYEEQGVETFASDDYNLFFAENRTWLEPYAVFSMLRETFSSPNINEWGKFRTCRLTMVRNYIKQHPKEAGLYFFVQYHLAKQLNEARDYAHQLGIALKGDLPIGVSANSVDVWMNPQLFNTDKQAGAPPDDFSDKGQNWEFPTYNWEAMAQTGYQWWRSRFENMSRYFDAFRIDHILGFFRIWEIPSQSVWGLLGYFNPSLPLSQYEIELYGLSFNRERFTEPYITAQMLTGIFGDAQKPVAQLFDRKKNGRYAFKMKYRTQRALLASLDDALASGMDASVVQQVMQLYTEVLFVPDNRNQQLFHPRISIQKSRSFTALALPEQEALKRLYEDFYYRRHNHFWKQQALRKLPALLRDNRMLVCGEDLGMVPSSVQEVMTQLNILSLEVQRMPKEFSVEFIHPQYTPYLSVYTTGTHDMSPIRSWWTENVGRSQRFYNDILGKQGAAPDNCSPKVAYTIVSQLMEAVSMWVILPLQDYLALDRTLYSSDEEERINNPDNPEHIWNYRMQPTLETLNEAHTLNHLLSTIITSNQR